MLRSTVFFLVIATLMLLAQLSYAQTTSTEIEQISRAALLNKDWIADANKCPSELMAQHEVRDHLVSNNCKSPNLSLCFSKCSEGEAGSCYWLAYALQQGNAESRVYEPIYQRACKLGVMSGCTNRAAGMSSEESGDSRIQACAVETYSKVCTFDDPWACTMYAFHLIRGIGVPVNKKLALKVLEKSCKYGTDDEACAYGMRLKAEAGGSKNGAAISK